MKKLLIAALLITGIGSFAQEKLAGEKMSAEQRTELHLKKMTLDLNLNEAQQKEMRVLIAEQNAKREKEKAELMAKREANDKNTADERFAKQNKRLDDQIAMKSRIKKVLTPEQFEKWESAQSARQQKGKDFAGERKSRKAQDLPK